MARLRPGQNKPGGENPFRVGEAQNVLPKQQGKALRVNPESKGNFAPKVPGSKNFGLTPDKKRKRKKEVPTS
jgi:hypothetical protein